MAFDSLAAFWAMGKHGPYVWFCYGITALVLLGLLWQARAERRRFFPRTAGAIAPRRPQDFFCNRRPRRCIPSVNAP